MLNIKHKEWWAGKKTKKSTHPSGEPGAAMSGPGEEMRSQFTLPVGQPVCKLGNKKSAPL